MEVASKSNATMSVWIAFQKTFAMYVRKVITQKMDSVKRFVAQIIAIHASHLIIAYNVNQAII